MSETPHKILMAALLRLLRPLVRLLLRHGISYATFAEAAKWVFVDVATDEFGINGRKQSVSRVSVLTGLSRKEVTRVQQLPRPDDRDAVEQYNRAARVVGGWLQDPAFTQGGDPLALPFEGDAKSFSELVRRYSGDVPARAILDELLRVKAVERLENGLVRLTAKAYIPQGSEAEKLHILGTDVSALITTIDHNLSPEQTMPLFQRKVAYDNLPDEALEPLRALAGEHGQRLLLLLNEWMAKHDRDTNPGVQGQGRNRAGLGIYYFEEPNGDKE